MAVNKVKLVLMLVLRFPSEALLRIPFRDGFWGMRQPTRMIANHFIGSRNEVDSRKLNEQLLQPFFQSWWNQGRINPIFHYLLDPESLLEGEEYQDGLFRVEMRVEGKKQHANVVFVTGRLFSIELPKPIKFYKDKEIQLGAVKRGNNRQSVTRAIDRLEHGKDFDD